MCEYSGTDNLEVMAEAVNYNKFLLTLIFSYAKRGDRIVDFGAGIGTFARELAQNGYRVHCIEPDTRQAQVITATGLSVSASLEEVEDESVDYLYSLNVLEHIEDDVTMLCEWRRKLKPGGQLLIYVPAFQLLYSSMDRKVGHFRRYTKGDLVKKLHLAGLAVKTAHYVDSIGFFAALAFRLTGNQSGDLNRRALVIYDRLIFPASRLCDRLFAYLFGKNVVVVAKK